MKKAQIIKIFKDNCIIEDLENGGKTYQFDDSNLNLVAEEIEFKLKAHGSK